MTDDYEPQKDGHDSYYLAIETKRLRGDKHDWVDKFPNPSVPSQTGKVAGASPSSPIETPAHPSIEAA